MERTLAGTRADGDLRVGGVPRSEPTSAFLESAGRNAGDGEQQYLARRVPPHFELRVGAVLPGRPDPSAVGHPAVMVTRRFRTAAVRCGLGTSEAIPGDPPQVETRSGQFRT